MNSFWNVSTRQSVPTRAKISYTCRYTACDYSDDHILLYRKRKNCSGNIFAIFAGTITP